MVGMWDITCSVGAGRIKGLIHIEPFRRVPGTVSFHYFISYHIKAPVNSVLQVEKQDQKGRPMTLWIWELNLKRPCAHFIKPKITR